LRVILDSNIIIYSLLPQHQTLRDLIQNGAPSASAISMVEVLGFQRLTPTDRVKFENMFAAITLFDVTRPVLDQAITLRQQRRMSVGDAIIAATALLHGKTLVTRNTADFAWISGLQLLDPLAPPPP
jgi:toxin FitB